MERISLPASAAPGPTKPEIRAVLLYAFDLSPGDRFVDVGAGTGAVSIEAAQAGAEVIAVEREPDRVEAIQRNVEANGVEGAVTLQTATAPDGLPETADVVFVGGTQELDGVLSWVESAAPRNVVLNAARLETAVEAIEAFTERGFDPTVRRLAVGRGTDLAGETSIVPDRPVYVISGTPEDER